MCQATSIVAMSNTKWTMANDHVSEIGEVFSYANKTGRWMMIRSVEFVKCFICPRGIVNERWSMVGSTDIVMSCNSIAKGKGQWPMARSTVLTGCCMCPMENINN
jgi:hypothetical protein